MQGVRGRLPWLVASIALLLALPSTVLAQGKIRVAIWEFENRAENHWPFYNDLGPAARNQIDTEFSQNERLSAKFSVIERDKLDRVLKTPGVAADGALDPTIAVRIGRILALKYIILGGIDKFNIDNTKGKPIQSTATIDLRFIDASTGDRAFSVSGDAAVKRGASPKATAVSKDSDWSMASEAIQKAVKAAVAKLTSGEYLAKASHAAGPTGAVEGKIIKVEGTRAWINLGASSGIKPGDNFRIFNVGEALVDPDTGTKLGGDEKLTGNGFVVEVQDKYAIVQFSGQAAAKDTVRKN
jgi:curli production assembly/transport component CsgG